MSGLLYREDMDAVRSRLTAWWNGHDIGRPAMQIVAPRTKPWDPFTVMPEPAGWPGKYSTSNFDYSVNLAQQVCASMIYMGEAMPWVRPELGPNALALYLGCRAVYRPDTMWSVPCISRPEEASFVFDESNFYWDFTLRLAREQVRRGDGRFVTAFPDLIEGLDTLAAMRGTQTFLLDLVERPGWVQECLGQITRRYFDYYDILYDLIKDQTGGSCWWAWAPGRMAKLQCDFSAMISPGMFGEFMVPVLREMTEKLDYSMYHWDGPGALGHLDHLLSLERLNMLQWTPGDGVEPVMDKRWWGIYHKTIEAGKKVFLVGFIGLDNLKAFKREFGRKLGQFMIRMDVESPQQGEEAINLVTL